MKKSVLYMGIGYFIFGIILFIIALTTEFQIEAILWGLCGAAIGPGIAMICKYVYWTKPEKQAAYREKLKIERIEMRDERKIMLRDRSGRITYMIMIFVYVALIMVFSGFILLDFLMPFSRYLLIGFSALLIFQYVCGIIVFNKLNKEL